jgi:molybdate transport system ATP-binding protein
LELLDIEIVLARRAFDLRACLSLGAETVALVGPSGAGKTSLLRAIAGLERPQAGRIALGTETWFDADQGRHLNPEHRRVGYLPQDYGLFPHLTVAGNVRFAARRERPDLLERFGIGHLAHTRPGQLSGGERQRAALARALARDPRVLLLDEPFGALDAITRRRVRDELADLLSELRLPSLLVTHAFEDAIVLAKRIGVLDRGSLVQLGPPKELFERPANALVAELTGANVLAGEAARTEFGALIRLDGGGELTTTTPADGPVQVAIQPWALELADATTSAFTDRVVSVREESGGLVVRCSRVTVRIVPGDYGGVAISEGASLGLSADPVNVRVLPGGDRSRPSVQPAPTRVPPGSPPPARAPKRR